MNNLIGGGQLPLHFYKGLKNQKKSLLSMEEISRA